MASHDLTPEPPQGGKASRTDRQDGWGGRRVSLTTAVTALLATVVLLASGGLWLGYHLFWDPFDRRPAVQVELERWQAEVQNNPSDAQAHYQLGWAYFQAGRADEAEAEYTRALELQPEHVGARYNLGVIARSKGDLQRAETLFRWIVEKYPRHELALYALGLTYMDMKRYDEAAQALQKALAVNPTSADAHYQLGLSYRAQGDNTRADQEFHTALRYNPKLEAAAQALSKR